MSLSNYFENALLTWGFTTDAAPTRPTAWYMAIHTADPGEDGTNAELVAADDANFVRKALTFTTPTIGSSSNVAAVSWTPTAGTFVVPYVSVWDALTGGNCLIIGQPLVSKTVDNANPYALSIGEIIAALA